MHHTPLLLAVTVMFSWAQDSGSVLYMVCAVTNFGLVLADFFCMVTARFAFAGLYCAMAVYTAAVFAIMGNSTTMLCFAVADAVFVPYILFSKRIAVIYGTRDVRVTDAPAQPAEISIPHMQSVIARAYGYPDFTSMVRAHPELDNYLAQAVGLEEMDRVAAACGYDSFTELYVYACEALREREAHIGM